MSCNFIPVPFTVTLKKGRAFFFFLTNINCLEAYTHKKTQQKLYWFYLYQGQTTLSPENSTRRHMRVHAGYLELCYGSFSHRFNFKEKD